MNQAGLGIDLLAEFYIAALNKLTEPGVIAALYHDYVDFCLARDVQPGCQVEFIEITDRFARRLLTVIDDEGAR
jgi:hypothetical protein